MIAFGYAATPNIRLQYLHSPRFKKGHHFKTGAVALADCNGDGRVLGERSVRRNILWGKGSLQPAYIVCLQLLRKAKRALEIEPPQSIDNQLHRAYLANRPH